MSGKLSELNWARVAFLATILSANLSMSNTTLIEQFIISGMPVCVYIMGLWSFMTTQTVNIDLIKWTIVYESVMIMLKVISLQI